MHPSRTSGAPVAYSPTSDVSGTYRAVILGSRPWIQMYVAHHQNELELGTLQSGRRHSGFVVELSIGSAAANEQQTVWTKVISSCRCRLLTDGCTTCMPRSLEPYVLFRGGKGCGNSHLGFSHLIGRVHSSTF